MAASPTLEGVTGKYYSACKEKAPAPLVHDDALRTKLWDVSMQLTGAHWS